MERLVRPTERGQVTIPKNIRKVLHISAGTPLVTRQKESRIIQCPDVTMHSLALIPSQKWYTPHRLTPFRGLRTP